jgi:hypothetical protein
LLEFFIILDDEKDTIVYKCTGCEAQVWIPDLLFELGLHPNLFLSHILCGGEEIDIVSGTIVE